MIDINKNITILSLDGGGTRGIYTAQLLAKVEQELGIQIRDCFDLIVGTSTGAIVAGAAVLKITLNEIIQLFDQEVQKIFKRKWIRNQQSIHFITFLSIFRNEYGSIPSSELLTSKPDRSGNLPRIILILSSG